MDEYSYAPLWETMKRKGITQYNLIQDYHISTGTLDTLRKNKGISLHTVRELCKILQCPIKDIVEFPDLPYSK